VPQRITDVKTLVTALNREGVDYVVIGGIALVLQGGAHVTFDVDLAFARGLNNIEHVVKALEAFKPRPRGFDPDLRFIWDAQTVISSTLMTLETSIGDVDLLGETPGVDSYQELVARSTEIELDRGVVVRVASLHDLLAMKKAAGRTKDERHISELQALIELDRTSET